MSFEMSNDETRLSDKYLIDLQDEQLSQWNEILKSDKGDELVPDWYSTKTFDAFLGSLDISQPTTGVNKSINVCSFDKTSASVASSGLDGSKTHDKLEATQERHDLVPETILSAEALKILSELPDLSQMSATRSFIFRTNKTFKAEEGLHIKFRK